MQRGEQELDAPGAIGIPVDESRNGMHRLPSGITTMNERGGTMQRLQQERRRIIPWISV
jgi:hypothetical protein